MADKLSVDLGALRATAITVRGHGDDLDTSHESAEKRLTSAATGWKGQSEQALTTFAANMKSRTASAVERIDAHSSRLHDAVEKYGENEDQQVDAMSHLDSASHDA